MDVERVTRKRICPDDDEAMLPPRNYCPLPSVVAINATAAIALLKQAATSPDIEGVEAGRAAACTEGLDTVRALLIMGISYHGANRGCNARGV